MTKDQTLDTLRSACGEIERLRQRNMILEAKVEVMDAFMCVLHTKPAECHNQGFGIDVSWEVKKLADEIEVNGLELPPTKKPV
jgi:hypothetical protein